MKISFNGKIYDLQDLTDMWDETVRTIEKLEKTLANREQDIDGYITQLDIKNKEIRRLTADNEALKALIPHQVDERG